MFWIDLSLTCVVKHLTDLAGESGDDGSIEECVETCEDDTADNNADDDLYAGIDIALTRGGFDGGSCGNDCGVALVLDGVDKLFHNCFSFLILKFLWFTFSVRELHRLPFLWFVPTVRFQDVACIRPARLSQAALGLLR